MRFGSVFFFFYKNHPSLILFSSFKLNFLPHIFISFIIFPMILPIFIALTLRLSWARGRFSSRLAMKKRKKPPFFFLGLGTSLKVYPLISCRAIDWVKFLDASMAFLSSDPSSEIGFFPPGSGPSSWPFWLQF
ncbi:hypothetical protein AMTRI_Chr02g215980 [Amborella trichopoda]